MNPDFHASARTPLSAAGEARKRELLPALQRELGRRRARREAVAGSLVVAAAAVIVAAGALVSLRAQPGAGIPPRAEQMASADGSDSAPAPGEGERAEQRAAPVEPRTRPASFTIVHNNPALVERSRIDDRRLVQELRSAGYEAGLVRTGDRVFIMMNDER